MLTMCETGRCQVCCRAASRQAHPLRPRSAPTSPPTQILTRVGSLGGELRAAPGPHGARGAPLGCSADPEAVWQRPLRMAQPLEREPGHPREEPGPCTLSLARARRRVPSGRRLREGSGPWMGGASVPTSSRQGRVLPPRFTPRFTRHNAPTSQPQSVCEGCSYDGALLAELYTRDGVGLMISRDAYEEVRKASESDLRAIQDLIRPLEERGVLVARIPNTQPVSL